jgi:hypothetical protein
MDMPSEFRFNFGFVSFPESVEFNRPGKMTIELPAGTDISEFKGFYFQVGGSLWERGCRDMECQTYPLAF